VTVQNKNLAKVVLADEDYHVHEVIEWACAKENIKYISALNGQSVLELAAAEKPDLIVLDTQLAEGKGITLLKKLKSNMDTKDISVVMLCPPKSRLLRRECMRHGAKNVIYKSGRIADLATSVSGLANIEAISGLCKGTSTLIDQVRKNMLKAAS
jgi:DNA-binding response OmpR family regulator